MACLNPDVGTWERLKTVVTSWVCDW